MKLKAILIGTIGMAIFVGTFNCARNPVESDNSLKTIPDDFRITFKSSTLDHVGSTEEITISKGILSVKYGRSIYPDTNETSWSAKISEVDAQELYNEFVKTNFMSLKSGKGDSPSDHPTSYKVSFSAGGTSKTVEYEDWDLPNKETPEFSVLTNAVTKLVKKYEDRREEKSARNSEN